MPEPMEPLLIEEREACRMLGGMCPKTLYNLRRTAGLPFMKIGTRVLYNPSQLRQWVESRAAQQAEIAVG